MIMTLDLISIGIIAAVLVIVVFGFLVALNEWSNGQLIQIIISRKSNNTT